MKNLSDRKDTTEYKLLTDFVTIIEAETEKFSK